VSTPVLTAEQGRARQLELYAEHPNAAVQALFMDEVSLALNPNQPLMKSKSLLSVITAAGHFHVVRDFLDRLNAEPHAVYDVRRILRPHKNDPTKLANCSRAVPQHRHGQPR
jgi:hypothetical protein